MKMFKIKKLGDSIAILKDVNIHTKVKDNFHLILGHFTNEFTCKQCNVTIAHKERLKRHLLSHENKRQFKYPHEGCWKTFNTKDGVNNHKVVHLENNFCNYCSIQTNRLKSLDNHIKGKHTKQGLVKCNFLGCNKKFTKINLFDHMKLVHSTNQFKCSYQEETFKKTIKFPKILLNDCKHIICTQFSTFNTFNSLFKIIM